jgi:hypothetical protein
MLNWIARRLAPYIWSHLRPELTKYLSDTLYGATITREMVEELAHHTGHEITFDLQTGTVQVVDL